MNKPFVWSAMIVAVAAAVGYFAWNLGNPELPTRAVVEAPEAAAPAAEEPTAPAIQYPIETAAEPEASLPPLDGSDEAFGDALVQLLGVRSLPAWLYPDGMIRRIVVTIDNLPRARTSARLMPVAPVGGRFVVSGSEENLAIDPANAARYRRYLDLLERVDLTRLVDVYVRFYPLFQQAYVELGYPKGYFNDRLVETLDDLLAAPTAATPTRLVQPHVLYRYADGDLERRSAGQKIMLRMGGENAGRVKQTLAALRSEVVQRAAQAPAP